MKRFKFIALIILSFLFCGTVSAVDLPIASDARIKTFVYNENEVFKVIIHYGYQTTLEFADGESIKTISIGNNYAWQLTPLGRRLFIKPLEENIVTNMTVLTNLRAYHFEVQSKALSRTIDEELAYVVRFYYPKDDLDQYSAMIGDNLSSAQSAISKGPVESFNFDYMLSGNKEISPLQVFDNGVNTFFKFTSNPPT